MKIFVVGGVGLGAEICDALVEQPVPEHEFIGVYDDDQRLRYGHGAPFLGTISELVEEPPTDALFILGLDDNGARAYVAKALSDLKLDAFFYQHATAVVSSQAVVEPGAYIAPFAFVGPHTSIGPHAVVNVHASVGCGSQIGEAAQICPGARISRSCQIGAGAFIGSNAIIGPGITVGARAKVAAGSFVFRNVPADRMAMGVPAKIVEN